MAKEAQLWNYLRDICLPLDIHASRIESETCPGFPDVHYTCCGNSGTIELKSTKNPRSKKPFSGKNGLRKSQKDWIREEIAAGGRVWLCLSCDPYVYWVNGKFAQTIHEKSEKQIEELSSYHWRRGEFSSKIRGELSTLL